MLTLTSAEGHFDPELCMVQDSQNSFRVSFLLISSLLPSLNQMTEYITNSSLRIVTLKNKEFNSFGMWRHRTYSLEIRLHIEKKTI